MLTTKLYKERIQYIFVCISSKFDIKTTNQNLTSLQWMLTTKLRKELSEIYFVYKMITWYKNN